ncbi:protein MAIN-LIKE 2-like [Nicotiana sylvestris]|uniref:protein MAIN-LIKE 2-like n=1 Tax=Nicotiana sylvestris TaxID=4096 RepID=UPI00388C7D72
MGGRASGADSLGQESGRCVGLYEGERPQGDAAASGGSPISVTAIRQHLEELHPHIIGETNVLHIHRYTRLALLLLFGGVLFPNTSGNPVSMQFLHHLQQLDELPQYNWGAVVLAYLYRSMCRASMGTQSDVCGFLPLLQVADGPTTPSTDHASSTDNHVAAHPHIKRQHDEDDPDSIPGRQGMRLRPAAALKHIGCGTY